MPDAERAENGSVPTTTDPFGGDWDACHIGVLAAIAKMLQLSNVRKELAPKIQLQSDIQIAQPGSASYVRQYWIWRIFMKHLSWAVAAVVSVAGFSSAVAADMAVKAPAPPAPILTWAGFYAGINAGGNWGNSSQSLNVTSAGDFFDPGCFPPASFCQVNVVDVRNAGAQRLNTSGFVGGGQVGYNWQFGQAVVGIEGDFDFFRSAGRGTNTVPLVSGAAATATVTDSISTDWLFTLRPRLGWAVNNWFFYGTGGLAVSNLKSNWTLTETRFGNTAANSVSDTKAGWTVGAGVETRFAQGWSLGLEYLFVHFDNISATVPVVLPRGGGPTPQNFFHSADLESNIVRVKLNYRFNTPVVARY